MKSRITLLVALVFLLALAGAALAQSDSSPSLQPDRWYRIEPSTLTGNSYQLASRAWQFDSALAGGDYHLQALSAPDLHGNGCCCTFLPCQWLDASP